MAVYCVYVRYFTKLGDARNFSEVSRALFASRIVYFVNVSLLCNVNTLRNFVIIQRWISWLLFFVPYIFLWGTLLRHIIIIVIIIYNVYRVFPGGKERPGRDPDPSPPSSAVVIKG